MGITRQSVQRIADLLVERGLAEYLPNPAHRRAKLLAPTERGRAAVAPIGPGHAAFADRLAEALGEDGARRGRPASWNACPDGRSTEPPAPEPSLRNRRHRAARLPDTGPDYPRSVAHMTGEGRRCDGELGPGDPQRIGGVPAARAARRGRHGPGLPRALRPRADRRREAGTPGAGRAGGVPGAVPPGGARRAAGRRASGPRPSWTPTPRPPSPGSPPAMSPGPSLQQVVATTTARCPSARCASSPPASRTP